MRKERDNLPWPQKNKGSSLEAEFRNAVVENKTQQKALKG
jgi:hypothetical protein